MLSHTICWRNTHTKLQIRTFVWSGLRAMTITLYSVNNCACVRVSLWTYIYISVFVYTWMCIFACVCKSLQVCVSVFHQPINREISSFSCKLCETARKAQTASSFPNSKHSQIIPNTSSDLNKDETNEATSSVSTMSGKMWFYNSLVLKLKHSGRKIKNICNIKFQH